MPSPDVAALGERIVVMAPVGRDAPLLCEVLDEAGIASDVCEDVDDLMRRLQDCPGAVLFTEDAMAPAIVSALVAALAAQPPWSDLPLVLLAGAEPFSPASAKAIATLRVAGNLILLERPVRRLTLVTAAQAALRARRRQYELRDLIEREQAARQDAETARREAQRASLLKDEFLATVSHELRTPISASLLWARLLRGGRLDPERERRALEAVERSAEAQSQLIEDLLDVSRMTTGKLKLCLAETELEPVARAALEVVRPSAETKQITLESTLDPQAGAVRADPARVQQILSNMLHNAVKFTPAGGHVSVRLWRHEGQVHIEVADTGRGISPEFLPHVFERFRQADATTQRLQGGLGLGLSISRQLVELHGGTIEADSPGEGQGAVFRVAFPLAAVTRPEESPEPAAPCAEAAPKAPSLEGIHVLLVEDDASTREAMAFTLGQEGIEVTAVESGQAALALLGDGAVARPHVLLSDVGMPGMDGYELLRRVRSMEKQRGQPALPAVALTAYARMEDRWHALEAGFAAHLPKPIDMKQLAAAIARLSGRAG